MALTKRTMIGEPAPKRNRRDLKKSLENCLKMPKELCHRHERLEEIKEVPWSKIFLMQFFKRHHDPRDVACKTINETHSRVVVGLHEVHLGDPNTNQPTLQALVAGQMNARSSKVIEGI